MSASLRDKALTALAQERVRVLRATGEGIALEITSSKQDAQTLQRPTYRTMVYRRDGELVRECSCAAWRRCYHQEVACLIWQPNIEIKESHR